MAPTPCDGAKPYTRRAEIRCQPPRRAAKPPYTTRLCAAPPPAAPRSSAAPRQGEAVPRRPVARDVPRKAARRARKPEAPPGCPPRRNRPPSRPCRAPAPAPAKPPPRARRDRPRSRAAPPRAPTAAAPSAPRRRPAAAAPRRKPAAVCRACLGEARRPARFRALLRRSLCPGRGDQIPVRHLLETAAPSRVNFREIADRGYQPPKTQKSARMARSDAVVAQAGRAAAL